MKHDARAFEFAAIRAHLYNPTGERVAVPLLPFLASDGAEGIAFQGEGDGYCCEGIDGTFDFSQGRR